MKSSLLLLAGLALPLAAVAEDQGTLRVGGSTTLLPVVATAANDFMEKYGTWDKVDPALPAQPVVIFVTGGGSGFGVKAAANGTVDIGLVSRELKDKEKELLGVHQLVLLGRDGVAVAVSARSPLAGRTGFTTEELARIFAGEIKTQKDLDPRLTARPFVLLVRDAGAGSAEIFQEKVMGTRGVSRQALQMPSQGALLQKLESNPQAIAYVSSGLAARSPELKAFAIDGKAPSAERILSGEYPLARPLYALVKGAPGPLAKRFLDYLSGEGQLQLAAQGFQPVREVREAAR
jgi:phosphate transport system substrate-binding protein